MFGYFVAIVLGCINYLDQMLNIRILNWIDEINELILRQGVLNGTDAAV